MPWNSQMFPPIRPLPVSVAGRRAAADAEGRSAFARSWRAWRSDSRGRRLIGSLRGDSIPADGAAYTGTVRPYVLHWRYG